MGLMVQGVQFFQCVFLAGIQRQGAYFADQRMIRQLHFVALQIPADIVGQHSEETDFGAQGKQGEIVEIIKMLVINARQQCRTPIHFNRCRTFEIEHHGHNAEHFAGVNLVNHITTVIISQYRKLTFE